MKSVLLPCLAAVSCIAVASAAQGAPAPGRALGLNSNAPIAVNADSFLADLNGETGTYTGNVVVSQGQVKLHADQVKILAPKGRASRMEATGHVVVDSPSGQAIGNSGIYDLASQILRLTGNVVLTKDSNVMRGSALEVSMATGLAKLMGAAPSPTEPNGRVQGLFVPAQRPEQSTSEPETSPPAP